MAKRLGLSGTKTEHASKGRKWMRDAEASAETAVGYTGCRAIRPLTSAIARASVAEAHFQEAGLKRAAQEAYNFLGKMELAQIRAMGECQMPAKRLGQARRGPGLGRARRPRKKRRR